MNKVRVLVVDDSKVVRELLAEIIQQDPRLCLAGSAANAEEALAMLARVAPDVITMDIRMPGMNGFEATQRIMMERPTPIVVVSASTTSEELNITMNALRAGALTVVEKPVGTTHREYATVADHLRTQLLIMSEVKVVRQRTSLRLSRPRLQSPPRAAGPYRAIGLVTSTGGPNALVKILGALPPDFPLPILLVQHITATFFEGFVQWLGAQCRLPVGVARDHDALGGGQIYVAPPGAHLTVNGTHLRLRREVAVDGQLPSGTVLLESMARALGAAALGVVLTGMGADGARGLLAIHQAGGYTIAEDESTAVVFGMPAEAVALRAVRESLPLPDVAPRLLQLAAVKGAS